ncbi:hypothetical protein ES692_08750 [Psychroserpens burtonensis]|uniref:Uncharacterized protein n=1 Tax=Psychroserpens burtonensis TaxID=49278 RepID=A0A5C7B921_9FLAO|nr:hypothetical protein [Psychroserpens burtonensis]TXE17643.1 hypothetical protein ES692_08750 [Psychroserpens burtonensis]
MNVNISNNFILSEKLKTITKISKLDNPNMDARDVYNAQFDFNVDTDIANYIEYGSYHSYTFPIIRNIDNGLIENLLLSLQQDDTYRAFLITYDLTDNEREQVQNGIEIDLEGKITASILDDENWVNDNFIARDNIGGDGSGCVEFVTTTGNFCENEEGEKIRDNGQLGNGCSQNWTTETVTNLVVDANCLSGGGPNNGTDNGNNNGTDTGTDSDNGSGGGGGSGTGNGDPNNTDDCQPTIDNPCPDDMTVIITPKPQNTKTTHQKNCEELNKLTSPPAYNMPNPFLDDNHPGNASSLNTNPRLAILNSDQSLNNSVETGFSLRNDGNFPQHGPFAKHVSANNQTHGVDFPLHPNQYGTVHTHPFNTTNKKWIPMFSLDDIYSVLQIRNLYTSSPFLNSNNPNGDALFVSVLIAYQGDAPKTYAIKVDDITKFQNLQAVYNDMNDANGDGIDEYREMNQQLEDLYIENANDSSGTEAQYQKVLLKFISDLDIGASLYQMEQTNEGTSQVQETWKKLDIGLTDNVIDSQC